MFESSIVDGKFEARCPNVVPWWSFTKTVLAAAVLKLVEQKRLDLDALIAGKPFTLRHLLQHTSGTPDYGALEEYHAAVSRGDEPWSVDELLARVNADRLLCEPGTKFVYSNVGYLFVRQIIENITGHDIASATNDLVFEPLEITGANFALSAEDLHGLGVGTYPYHPGWVYHGLILGPLDDAVQLLDRITWSTFLSEKLKVEMTNSFLVAEMIPDRPFRNAAYGLGLMVATTKKGLMAGHTGEGPGSSIAIYSFPECEPRQTAGAWGLEGAATLEKHVISRIP